MKRRGNARRPAAPVERHWVPLAAIALALLSTAAVGRLVASVTTRAASSAPPTLSSQR